MTSPRFLNALKWILIVFFVFVFSFKTFTFIDPDLGWHLRAGEIVTQTGHAPQTDPWTYTMQGHEWIDHEWLLDAIMWKFWENGNWLYIQILFLFAGLFPLLVWIWRVKYPIELIWISLGGFMLLDIVGVRPQVLSFLLFFVVWEILSRRYIEKQLHKLFYALPLLFLVWANIHAGFVAGLGVFTICVIFLLFREYYKKNNLGSFMEVLRNDGIVLALSFLATLLTPYGIDLWLEIINSTTTPLIREIGEWQSSFVSWNIVYALFMGLFLGLIVALHKKLHPLEIGIAILLLLASVSHARMLPILLIVAIPLFAKCTNEFYKLLVISPDKDSINRISLYISIVLVCIMLISIAQGRNIITPYQPPQSAIQVESELHRQIGGNTFNEYGFGGAIIFNDSSRKVFIDGRLPHWKNSEGYSAFQNYLDVVYVSGEWRHTFLKYDIRMVILSREHDARIDFRLLANEINTYSPVVQKILRLTLPSKVPILLPELLENGWCMLYRDEEATILVSPDTSLCRQKTAR